MAECIKYISRQDTLDYIENEYCMDCEHSDGVLCKDCHYEDCMDIIRAMPATDVQSARFARWIDLDNRILCSGCGAGYDDSDEVKQNTYIFCPNCGARMDGDVE